MGRRRKKKRTHVVDPSVEEGIPRSFVFLRKGKGKSKGSNVARLVKDMRVVMQPHTAMRLREAKRNRMKDFVSVAGPLGVTHFLAFSHTDVGINMRVIRLPRGPTLTFRVINYSLMKDIVAAQKRPHSPGKEFQHPPLVVLNNFSGQENHKRLMAAMFQNMFPSIDVARIDLKECRRVLLLHFDSATEQIEMRHYVVNASPIGITKSVKKIVKAKLPDLSKFKDISDFVFGAGEGMSDSEVEDTPDSRVTLPQDFSGRGNRKAHKSAIRLKEVGPRMRLELLKIEEELDDGRVIYHRHVTKTSAEERQLAQQKAEREAARAERKRQQEENVAKKQAAAEAKLERKRQRRALARQNAQQDDGDDDDDDDDSGDGSDGESSDSDDEKRPRVRFVEDIGNTDVSSYMKQASSSSSSSDEEEDDDEDEGDSDDEVEAASQARSKRRRRN